MVALRRRSCSPRPRGGRDRSVGGKRGAERRELVDGEAVAEQELGLRDGAEVAAGVERAAEAGREDGSVGPLPLPRICVMAFRRRELDQQTAVQKAGGAW